MILHHLCGKGLPTKKIFMTADTPGLLKMERYTKEQRVFIAQQYIKNNEDLAVTVSNFRTKHQRNSNLTSSNVKKLIKIFEETGSISDLNTLTVLQQVVKHKTSKEFVRVLLRV